ncbi:MAG: HAD-IA family hydrolase [Bacteroidota bacterium]
MDKQLLIFDFDGTIADTLMVAEEILNETGGEFGLPQVSRQQLLELKGKSISELLKLSGISWLQLPKVIRRLRSRFRSHMTKVPPIHGMPEILFALRERGYRMGILSSNTQEGIRTFLDKHDLPPFEFILTPDSIFGKGKAIRSTLKKTALPPESVVMIGDELRDVEAANKAGIESIAVTWGFNSAELLQNGAPCYIVNQPGELLAIFSPAMA